MQVESGKIYRYFKGDYYVVVGEATDTETGKRVIVYHPLQFPNILYVLSKDKFFGEVLGHTYPGYQITRFIPVTREEVLRDAGK